MYPLQKQLPVEEAEPANGRRISPVIASLRGREEKTGNMSAVCRLEEARSDVGYGFKDQSSTHLEYLPRDY